jgi:hypothetical protein
MSQCLMCLNDLEEHNPTEFCCVECQTEAQKQGWREE